MSARRVLYTDYYPFVGGGQQVLLSIFKAMDRKRWQPMLVLRQEGPFAEAARALKVPVFIAPMGKARWRLPWQAWPAMRRLRALMRGQKADLVHANDFPSHKLAVVAARGLGLPEIYHQHIAVLQKPGSSTGLLMRLHLRHATRILTVSQNSLRDLAALGVPESKLSLLYNSADIPALAKAKPAADASLRRLGLPLRRPLMLAAGMHRPHKGFDVLLRAADLAFGSPAPGRRKTGPAPFLALLGDTAHAEAGHEDLLLKLAAAPALRGNLALAPAQRPLAPWLKRCSLFISSSRWEGSPLVVLEAMAAGCPVLATRQAAGEVLEHGRTGWLVNSEDAAALAAGMAKLMADAGLRRRLGLAAAREAARRFSLTGYVAELLDRYDALVAG
jgi:glycosyltransferase involved in cell wall biosynthesis